MELRPWISVLLHSLLWSYKSTIKWVQKWWSTSILKLFSIITAVVIFSLEVAIWPSFMPLVVLLISEYRRAVLLFRQCKWLRMRCWSSQACSLGLVWWISCFNCSTATDICLTFPSYIRRQKLMLSHYKQFNHRDMKLGAKLFWESGWGCAWRALGFLHLPNDISLLPAMLFVVLQDFDTGPW